MPTSRDERYNLVPLLQAYEDKILTELSHEQVTHVDLAAYQPGQPHYESLLAAMDHQTKYQWPSILVNL